MNQGVCFSPFSTKHNSLLILLIQHISFYIAKTTTIGMVYAQG
jgi:hypothetical protein